MSIENINKKISINNLSSYKNSISNIFSNKNNKGNFHKKHSYNKNIEIY